MEIKVISHVSEVMGELESRIPTILEALGLEAEGNAIKEINELVYDAPESSNYVRTGNLKNSLTHAKDDKYAYIGSNVKYAPYVELGTSKMASRPFLRNAITKYVDDYKQIMEEGLK